jgi:transposase
MPRTQEQAVKIVVWAAAEKDWRPKSKRSLTRTACRRNCSSRRAKPPLGRLREGTILLADKAYDGDWLRLSIEAAAPNIASKVIRRWRACFKAVLYGERNRIERFFNKIKHCRRIATRYEKHASNFLAMIKLAAVRLWLRHYESMT